MSRLLSYTEVSTALTCFARWDFAYGGHLAGETLKPRETAPILSGGRAWGAAVAAWHATSGQLVGDMEAHAALARSLWGDAEEAKAKGFPIDPERLIDQADGLGAILDHYVATAERLPGLAMLEGELNVPIPSRTGRRGSSRYRFHCYLDGHTVKDGLPWIVEFKLRSGLTPSLVMERQPQYRWYALAYAIEHGIRGPVGVLIDERLNAAPLPARIVKAKRKGDGIDGKTVSHAADQMTTPELYLAACAEYGVEPEPATVESLGQRRWQQRFPLIFTPDELKDAARELTGAAQLIRDLDSGAIFPIRNGNRGTCQGCRFALPCGDPSNDFSINALFERTVPKRLRGPKPEGAR